MPFLGMYWGEANNPKNKQAREGGVSEPDYDKARHYDVDPNIIRWTWKPTEKAVRQYMELGRRPFWDNMSDGDPWLVVDEHGAVHGHNGRCRAEAARRQGKTLKARVWDVRRPDGAWKA